MRQGWDAVLPGVEWRCGLRDGWGWGGAQCRALDLQVPHVEQEGSRAKPCGFWEQLSRQKDRHRQKPTGGNVLAVPPE